MSGQVKPRPRPRPCHYYPTNSHTHLSATHLAEEVPQPERSIPFAIMGTIAIGFFTSFIYSIAVYFSMSNLEGLVESPTGVPILALYYQATGSLPGATFLEFLICFTGLGCQIGCHTWQARLCWSFARDRGLPGSRYWVQVDKRLGVPFLAHTGSCIIVGILGVLYIGSTTAFNSMVTACIVLLYISYAIPVVLLLMKGRDNIKHGPFWMGRFGLFCNYVLLIWTAFTLVMYSFPYSKPIKAGSKFLSLSYPFFLFPGCCTCALGGRVQRWRLTYLTSYELRLGRLRRCRCHHHGLLVRPR